MRIFLPMLLMILSAGCRNLMMPGGGFENEPALFTASSDRQEAQRILGEIHSLSERLQRQLDSLNDEQDDPKDDLEEKLRILAFAQNRVESARTSAASPHALRSAAVLAERMVRSVKSPTDETGWNQQLIQGKNLLGSTLHAHRLPWLAPEARNKPVGEILAREEAAFLYNPDTRNFFTVSELAALSANDISRLDVSDTHPAWFRQTASSSLGADRVKDFIRWMENGMTEALHAEGDLDENLHWNSKRVRRVMFMEELYQSATSAKGVAEDAYGVEWKFKWGDEVHAEAVASRLYLMLGGKATDLSFVGGPGPDEMILILNQADEYTPTPAGEDAERDPATVRQFIQTLDDFYGFDLRPYIHSHGIITEQNVDRLLRHLPPEPDEDYKPEHLIGREWISFIEYSMELKPQDYIIRYDGSRMSDHTARNDRVARGLYLFNLWITNRDAKDDNNKAYYIMRPPSKGEDPEIVEYREGMHDLGLSFGTLKSGALVNDMTVGPDFLRRSSDGNHLLSSQSFICIPEAWSQATWADGRWMAEKIASLSEADIRSAVAATRWPDFAQSALSYKLIARRNRIAEFYGCIDLLDQPLIDPPRHAVSLDSPNAIRRTEHHYQLKPGSLAAALKKANVDIPYTETVLTQGQLVSSKDSHLIRLLVQQRHPSGLHERYNRSDDRHPFPLR